MGTSGEDGQLHPKEGPALPTPNCLSTHSHPKLPTLLTPDQDVPLPPDPLSLPRTAQFTPTSLDVSGLLTNTAACYLSGRAGYLVSLHGRSCLPGQQARRSSGAQVSLPWLPSCLKWQMGLVCQVLGPQYSKPEQSCIELPAFSAHF